MCPSQVGPAAPPGPGSLRQAWAGLRQWERSICINFAQSQDSRQARFAYLTGTLFNSLSVSCKTASLIYLYRFEALGGKFLSKWNVQTNYHKRNPHQSPASDKIVPEVCLLHFVTDTPDKVLFQRAYSQCLMIDSSIFSAMQ